MARPHRKLSTSPELRPPGSGATIHCITLAQRNTLQPGMRCVLRPMCIVLCLRVSDAGVGMTRQSGLPVGYTLARNNAHSL